MKHKVVSVDWLLAMNVTSRVVRTVEKWFARIAWKPALSAKRRVVNNVASCPVVPTVIMSSAAQIVPIIAPDATILLIDTVGITVMEPTASVVKSGSVGSVTLCPVIFAKKGIAKLAQMTSSCAQSVRRRGVRNVLGINGTVLIAMMQGSVRNVLGIVIDAIKFFARCVMKMTPAALKVYKLEIRRMRR